MWEKPIECSGAYRLCLTLLVVLAGCKLTNQLVDYRVPRTVQERAAIRSAPIVLLGSVTADREAGPVIRSYWNKKVPLQLHEIRVAIEGYLRGTLNKSYVDLYYYRFAGPYDGPPPLGYWKSTGSDPDGSRRIFFVRQDGDLLRLACDGENWCTTRVGSGSHPELDALTSADQSLEQKIAKVLFTKGVGVTDHQFGESLAYSVGCVDYQDSVPKLEQLIAGGNPEIRKGACYALESVTSAPYTRSDERVRAICQKKD